MVRRTKKFMFAIFILMISVCWLEVKYIMPAKASSGSPVVEWTTTYGAQAVVQTEEGGYLFAGSELGLLVKADSLGHIEWNRSYEGTSNNVLSVFKTADGKYVATGVMEDKTWLLKADASGNVLWNKTHEIDATCVVQTDDEGYIFVGNILLKIDASGGLQWSKPVEGSWVAETEGGYIISSGVGGNHVRLIRTDANGIVEWDKTCVLIDPASPTSGGLFHMIGTSDGGVIFVGWSYGGAGSQMLRIYKFNSTGDKEWEIGQSGSTTAGAAIVQTDDGGYAMTGKNVYTASNAFLIKINQTGGFQWEVRFGPDNYCGIAVIETMEGGFVVTGQHIYKFSPYPRHNIAISKVTVPSGRVKEGDSPPINVTVENNGDYDETTEVFLYNHSSSIDSRNVTLLKGASDTVTFFWNTTGVKLGQHLILANATMVTGETYIQDNIGQAMIMIAAGSKISISTVTSTILIGLQIGISGTLTDHREKAISGELISLSYKVLGLESWNVITSVYTEANGHYSAVWIPTAIGYFTLKAEWNGNATHFGASNSATLSVIPYNSKYVFTVESNSTISALTFNSTANELSFTANGPSGTMGYARVFISKELVANISDLKVYVDETQVDYVAAPTDDSWLLYFVYEHSTHNIVVVIPEFPSVLILPLLMIFTLGTVVFSKKRKQNAPRKKSATLDITKNAS